MPVAGFGEEADAAIGMGIESTSTPLGTRYSLIVI